MLSRSLLFHAAIVTWSVTLVSAADTPNTGMADPAALISAFDQYAASLASTGAREYPGDAAHHLSRHH